jgi:hypothetical protein
MSGKSKHNANQAANQLPGGQNAVNAPVMPCAANKDPQLKVKVWAKVKGKKVSVAATVSASALSKASAAGDGVADFGYVLPGTYDVGASAILAPHDEDYYTQGPAQSVTLARGDKKTVNVEVKPRNVITPKVEVEYKVVVFDPDLAQHEVAVHDPPAADLKPQPTRVEVSMSCSETDPAYTGGGTVAAPNCEIFLDETCQQPLNGRKLTHAELTAGSAMKLYLRGTTRGLFTLSLTLDPEADPRFNVKPPATEDMGVVALQLVLHEHVTPVVINANTYPLTGHCADLEKVDLIPDQLPLSDVDKVQKGRLLHKQSGKHHGRARALLKLTAAEWPAGTDDYRIVLKSTGSDLRAYDDEKEGKKQSLPLNTPASELKAADKELWIEGADTSKAPRDVRLSLGLDRASGGLSKSAKTNADWTRFTVVNIDSVKLEYTKPAAADPKPWNASKHTWYINYQAGDAGRTVKIRAKLTQKIAGVKLHFMLSPDKNNLKEKNWGIDVPAGWNWGAVDADVKQKDKDNATDLLHKSEDTDANGVADCELVLSQFGGDQFVPGVYISQDPHLAAYVHGHADLAERKPKLASDPIKVWRKFAYQKIKVRGMTKYPSTDTAENVYGRVRAKMLKRDSVYVDKATAQGWLKKSVLPEYMFKVGGSKTKLKLNVSDANQDQYFALVAAETEHPIKVPIITCDFNWANEGASGIVANFQLPPTSFPRDVTTTMHACDPPVQGGTLLAAGDWTAAESDGAGGWLNVRNGALAQGDVDINPQRDNINKVRVKLPAGVGAVTPATQVWISGLQINGAANHYLGGYNINPACPQTIVAVFDAADAADYQNTVVHELGHAFFQTGGVAPTAGIPPNPNYILDPTGPHCTHNVNKCVMFTSGPIAGSLNRYCPDCHPYLLVQDMSAIS